jgi:hypothetical protein
MSNSSLANLSNAMATNPMHSAAVNNITSSQTTFYDLSEATLITIESFLSSTDICRLQKTCKLGADAAARAEVWNMLRGRDFLDACRIGIEGPASTRSPIRDAAWSMFQGTGLREQATSATTSKQLYVQKYLENKRARQEACRVAAAEGHGLTLRMVLDVLQYCCGLGTPCLLICLWMVLVLLKLNASISIEWSHVWIPLWVMDGVVVCTGLLGICTRIMSNRATTTSMWHRQSEGDNYAIAGFARVLLHDLGRRRQGAGFLWYLINLVLAFIIFPALILAKLDGSITASWGVVFVPVWLIFAFWCCFPCAHEMLDQEAIGYLFIYSLVVLWAPLLCVLIMVVVRLDGKFIEAGLIFVPFYIVDCMLAGVVCFIASIAIVERDGRPLKIIAALCVCIAAFLPIPIYASFYDSKHGEFPVEGTMAPLIAAMCLLACVTCCGVWRLWKSSRAENFSNAWSLNRCSCRCLRTDTPNLPDMEGN